ncbi:alpha/beta hydrolase [Cereibacter azotoformans]|uniref:Pimeloyl-ACP methyl ester carboxylesterase n=1 Tax=Cereibacter azotoformans TaxID=43057 RepID=A0A2T5JWM2_9RHOB|nr:alpha/beta hydrolase [Cereibacter azotoformans]AXQ92972.1 alpha/beta hydrolase [Cereibacter sphaeroides]MBO4169348.1 alpha/beta hydrolase [Cereibacter azotoformans]PTR14552.1 pimeloyl-ACP methyl ester carboxylesterase [Cereibacter azotoformans]UIJ31265.1 alpha/beta hydrolase [Cereibacter azotoformans]
MPDPSFLVTPEHRRIAYRLTDGEGPAVVFCGGFKSDMEGTKALHLQRWAEQTGRAFLRFDYSGHGSSEGAFLEGAIGDWFEDARAACGLLAGPLVLVGSSMGGWISLLLARAMPERIAGLVGIAAAPDFTEDSMWAGFSEAQRAALQRDGQVTLPSDYSDEPYIITRRLIEEGRGRLVLRDPLDLPFPVRLLQGTADTDVPPSVALRLLDHATGPDIRLTLVKGADHRFSTPECLTMIEDAVGQVLGR